MDDGELHRFLCACRLSSGAGGVRFDCAAVCAASVILGVLLCCGFNRGVVVLVDVPTWITNKGEFKSWIG